MDWFETALNGVLFVLVIGGLILERKWSNDISKRLDATDTKLARVSREAQDANVRSLDAKRTARDAKNEVKSLSEPEKIVVPDGQRTFPDGLVERLRQAAHKADVKRAAEAIKSREAHPAGKGLVQTTESGVSFLPTTATKGDIE